VGHSRFYGDTCLLLFVLCGRGRPFKVMGESGTLSFFPLLAFSHEFYMVFPPAALRVWSPHLPAPALLVGSLPAPQFAFFFLPFFCFSFPLSFVVLLLLCPQIDHMERGLPRVELCSLYPSLFCFPSLRRSADDSPVFVSSEAGFHLWSLAGFVAVGVAEPFSLSFPGFTEAATFPPFLPS